MTDSQKKENEKIQAWLKQTCLVKPIADCQLDDETLTIFTHNGTEHYSRDVVLGTDASRLHEKKGAEFDPDGDCPNCGNPPRCRDELPLVVGEKAIGKCQHCGWFVEIACQIAFKYPVLAWPPDISDEWECLEDGREYAKEFPEQTGPDWSKIKTKNGRGKK